MRKNGYDYGLWPFGELARIQKFVTLCLQTSLVTSKKRNALCLLVLQTADNIKTEKQTEKKQQQQNGIQTGGRTQTCSFISFTCHWTPIRMLPKVISKPTYGYTPAIRHCKTEVVATTNAQTLLRILRNTKIVHASSARRPLWSQRSSEPTVTE